MRTTAPPATPAGPPPAVLATSAQHFRHDTQRVAIPHVEAQIVVRFGPTLAGGVDVHVLGPRTQVQRKFIRGGQRAVLARLRPGTYEAALGASAADLGTRPVPLDVLWGRADTDRLLGHLADTTNGPAAAARLADAITIRAGKTRPATAAPALLAAALDRLQAASVAAVAGDLGISERHLRRLLRTAMGVSPKAYVRVKRFERAVRLAQCDRRADWAAIAAETGYYDQSHLIADFRAIAGATPTRLLAELRAATQA